MRNGRFLGAKKKTNSFRRELHCTGIVPMRILILIINVILIMYYFRAYRVRAKVAL